MRSEYDSREIAVSRVATSRVNSEYIYWGNSHTGKVPGSFLSSHRESYVMRSEYDSREVAVSRVATPNYIYLSNKLVPGFIAEGIRKFNKFQKI